MFHSLLEGGQRFVLHVVAAATAEPVGGRRRVAVHCAAGVGSVRSSGALAGALRLRDHLE